MDFIPVVIWWFVTFIVGLTGWPLAFTLLRRLPDRGFTLARPVGLLLSSYILWLGATFRLLQNNRGGLLMAMALTLAIGLLWYRRQSPTGQPPSPLLWLKQNWPYALSVELLFMGAFVGWAIFKAYNPNIETAGGEKWMEITFINGILRSDYFPPQDPWLSGFGISYYYFGYVMMAGLTQLTGLSSTVAFNLYIPTLLAMTLTAALGLVANMVTLSRTANLENSPASLSAGPVGQISLSLPAIATGLAAALFVAMMGNLIGLLEVLHKRGLLPPSFWLWLDIRDLKIPPAGPSDSWIPDRFIWWWRGSRVLTDYNLAGREQEVIDEFPFFSFLLGDVHPHVLNLPFVLLALGLALNLLFAPSRSSTLSESVEEDGLTGAPPNLRNDEGSALALPDSLKIGPLPDIIDKSREILENSWRDLLTASGGRLGFLLYAICLGGLSFLNTWDFPIYLGITGLALTVWLAQRRPQWQVTLTLGIVGSGLLAVVSLLLYLPFYATFQSQARGLLPNLWNPTRLPQLFVFFGPFLVAVVMLLLVLAAKNRRWSRQIGWTFSLTLLGPVLAMLIVFSGILINPAGRSYIEGILNNPDVQAAIGSDTVGALVQESLWRRASNPWTFLLLGGLLGWTLAQLVGLSQAGQAQAFPAGRESRWRIEKFALILLIVGLGLPLAVEFVYLRDNFGTRMNTIFKFYFQAWVLLALVSAFALYYVSTNVRGPSRWLWQTAMGLLVAAGLIYPLLATLNKMNFESEPTLDGMAWISRQRPGDYAAIQWLREHAADDAVILEAPGSNYAAYQYTGRVSALTGLPTLLGWGGHQSQWRGNYEEPGRREPDIESLFNTLDLQQTRQLLDKYDVSYVYIGPLERERYAPQGLSKFERLLPVAFQQDGVTIYQVQPVN